jgi:hypothetical protein
MIRNFSLACMNASYGDCYPMTEETDFSKLQPTPEMVREAKKNLGGWVYAISGTYSPNDAVPAEAIAGAWKVDDKGNIIPGSFTLNPNYKKK